MSTVREIIFFSFLSNCLPRRVSYYVARYGRNAPTRRRRSAHSRLRFSLLSSLIPFLVSSSPRHRYALCDPIAPSCPMRRCAT